MKQTKALNKYVAFKKGENLSQDILKKNYFTKHVLVNPCLRTHAAYVQIKAVASALGKCKVTQGRGSISYEFLSSLEPLQFLVKRSYCKII